METATDRKGTRSALRRARRDRRRRDAEIPGTGMARCVVLARADERLLSGELVTAWIPAVGATRIAVVDDGAARDPFQMRILTALAPQGVPVQVYTVEEAARMLRARGTEEERLVVLAKGTEAFAALAREGILLRDLVLGGMGPRAGRYRVSGGLWLDGDEIRACGSLIRAGCRIRYQRVPEGRAVGIGPAVLERARAETEGGS